MKNNKEIQSMNLLNNYKFTIVCAVFSFKFVGFLVWISIIMLGYLLDNYIISQEKKKGIFKGSFFTLQNITQISFEDIKKINPKFIKFFIITTAFCVIYFITWYGYALYFKNLLLAQINKIPKDIVVEFKNGINVTGFPFKIGIKTDDLFVKYTASEKDSHFIYFVTKLIQKPRDSNLLRQQANSLKYNKYVLEYKSSQFELLSDYSFKNFTLKNNGKSNLLLTENYKELFNISAESDLQEYAINFLTNPFEAKKDSFNDFLNNIKKILFNSSRFILLNNQNNELITILGRGSYIFNNNYIKITDNYTKNNLVNLSFIIDLEEFALGKEYAVFRDNLMNLKANFDILNNIEGKEEIREITNNLLHAFFFTGKTNLFLNINYEGSIDPKKFAKGSRLIDVKQFKIKNDLINAKMSAKIDNNFLNGVIEKSALSLNLNLSFSQKLHNIIWQMNEVILNDIKKDISDKKLLPSTFTEIQNAINKLNPKLHEFGNIVLNSDIKINNTPFLIEINNLDFYSDLYGLKSRLLFKKDNVELIEGSVEILNYPKLIDDTANYLNKLLDLYSILIRMHNDSSSRKLLLIDKPNPQIWDVLKNTIANLDNGNSKIKNNAILKFTFSPQIRQINNMGEDKITQIMSPLLGLLPTKSSNTN